MRQLTSLDAQFLAFENQRQTGHVAGLAVFDTSTAPGGRLDAEVVKGLIRDRLSLLPPLRWRLVEVPFGLDYPYWVDDPQFDLDYHVRELALPRRGRTHSSPIRSRASCRVRSTASGRCGRSTSSTAWSPGTRRC
jgi:hypothetical protein